MCIFIRSKYYIVSVIENDRIFKIIRSVNMYIGIRSWFGYYMQLIDVLINLY